MNFLSPQKKINNASFFEKIFNIFYFQIYFLIKKKKSSPPQQL